MREDFLASGGVLRQKVDYCRGHRIGRVLDRLLVDSVHVYH